MNDPTRQLRDALAAMATTATGEDHPSVDDLAAYHAGELPPERQASVQDHLAACPECTSLLLDLGGLADPGFGAERQVSETEMAAFWSALQPRLEEHREATPPAAPVVLMADRRAPPASIRSPRWIQALAAALLAAVAGLSVWNVSLRGALEEAGRPQLNTPVYDLYPATAERSPGATPEALRLAPGSRLFTLLLNAPDAPASPGYAVEITRAGGDTVWSGTGLLPNAFGSFSLTLSRDLIGPGRYHVRLFGVDGERREVIAEYELQVSDRPPR